MSDGSAAERLYGGPPPAPAEGLGSILTDAQTVKPQEKAPAPGSQEAESEPDGRTALYGHDGGAGDPLDDYGPVTDRFFNRIDYQGRFDKNEALLAESTEARQQVNEFMADFQVGQSAAKEVVSLVEQYRETPLSDDAYDQTWENTLNGLKDKYGPEAKKMVAGAERVIADISKRIPAAKAYMDAGLNVNAQFIAHCIGVAKQKGYI